jgi:hypothetical protein
MIADPVEVLGQTASDARTPVVTAKPQDKEFP